MVSCVVAGLWNYLEDQSSVFMVIQARGDVGWTKVREPERMGWHTWRLN